MTKKDFITLADALKEARPSTERIDAAHFQWNNDVHFVALACRASNPNFNRNRWLNYIDGNCGPSGGKVK